MNLKNVASIGGIVLGHELIEKLLSSLMEGATKHGGQFIKANIFGLGTDDEYLFNSAQAYAVTELNVTPADLVRILQVIDSFPRPTKLRIVQIIGKNEKDVTVNFPVMDGDVIRLDKDGKKVFEKRTFTANIAGAQTIALWATMTDEQIALAIKAGNMNNPTGDSFSVAKIKSAAEAVLDTAKNAAANAKIGYDNIGHDMSAPNTLSRWADKFRK
ncbi:MAG: hypothetical protein PHE20_02710 [Patescibacteria group bacterium]|nr:hypothetical protein [Patescibacteria group bacterium]